MISRAALLEVILEGLAPVWYRWQGGEVELIAGLAAYLDRPDLADGSGGKAEATAIWILDRIVAPDQADFFYRFLGRRGDLARACALYAWGRRLGDRQKLFRIQFNAGWPDGVAAEAAWCESCPPQESASLLEWWQHLAAHLHEPTDGTLVVKEFARRVPDRLHRRSRLLELAAEGNAETRWDSSDGRPTGAHLWGAVREALVQVAMDLATSFVPSMEPLPPDDKIVDWFYGTLNEGGFHEVVGTCKEAGVLQKGRFSVKRLASLFWVERADWKRLVESLDEVEERHPYAALQRLGKAVPRDRLDAWDAAVYFPARGNYPIQEFCAWLKPEFRDLLPRFFADHEPERATCAFYGWLHKVPRAVLERFWVRRGSLSFAGWQVSALDRFLHAPAALRPPATVQDAQCVEADFRLLDLLNRRKF